MAISIDWATGIITIPQADLTLVSGTLYEADTNVIRNEIYALLSEDEGIPFETAINHNTEVTVAGVTYARTIEMINGYSVQFEDGQYSVRLVGSNNNLFDIEAGVLVQNQVQVIPTNSAGLVSGGVGGGGGATPAQIWAHPSRTLTSSPALDAGEVAEAVWDAQTVNHQDVGSFGEKLDNLNVNVDNASIAAAVWAHASRTLTDPAGVQPSDITDIANAVWAVTTRGLTEDVGVTSTGINAIRDAVWLATSRTLTAGLFVDPSDITDIRDAVWSATSRSLTTSVDLNAGEVTAIRDAVWAAATRELTGTVDLSTAQVNAIRDAVWIAASRTLTEEVGLLADERAQLLSLPDEVTIAQAVLNEVAP